MCQQFNVKVILRNGDLLDAKIISLSTISKCRSWRRPLPNTNEVCRSSDGLLSSCLNFVNASCVSFWNMSGHACNTVAWSNKKHLKNVEPIRHCEPFYIAIHQVSLLLHAACASMSTTTTTTMSDRGDCYGPIEWTQWQNCRPSSLRPRLRLKPRYRPRPGAARPRAKLKSSSTRPRPTVFVINVML